MIRATTKIKKTTQRLVLRPLELKDYTRWVEAYSTMLEPQNDWDETNWDDSELTLAKFKALLKQQDQQRKNDAAYAWGVFRKDDGTLIGEIALMDLSRAVFQNAYLGYRIYNPYWGQGFAGEACRAIVDLAFTQLKLHRLEAGISKDNRRSLRMVKSLGFRKEGLSKRRLLINGVWTDLVIYAATSEDFGFRFRGKI